MTKKASNAESKAKKQSNIEKTLIKIQEFANEVLGKEAKITFTKDTVKISLSKIAPKKKVGSETLKNPQLHFTIGVIEEDEGLVTHIKPRGCRTISREIHKKDATSIKNFALEIIEIILDESISKSEKFYEKKLEQVNEVLKENKDDLKKLHLTDMESCVYHSCPGESRSALLKLEESYLAYEHYKNESKEPSEAMKKGSAFHAWVLEPESFEDEVIVHDVEKRQSNVDKLRYKKWETTAVGKTLVSEKIMEEVLEGSKALANNKIGRTLLKFARKEESFFWEETHKITGIKNLFKCRPDGLIVIDTKKHKELLDVLGSIPSISGTIQQADLQDGDSILFDLKFTNDLSERKVTRNAFEQGYFFQGGHYSTGVETVLDTKVKLFFVINVQSEAPWDCSVELFDESCLSLGMAQREAAINTLCFHQENPDAHKGVNEEVRVLGADEWMLTKASDYLTRTKGMIAEARIKKSNECFN